MYLTGWVISYVAKYRAAVNCYLRAMTRDDPDEALAGAVAAQRRGACDGVRRLGEGSNNVVFLAEGAGGAFVVKLSKPHRAAGALGEYRKEAWCASAARARGVRTPQVLETGVLDGHPFALMDFAPGAMPSPPTCAAAASEM